MHALVEEKDGITFITLEGRMDATTTGAFEDVCKKAFSSGVKFIVVDMGQVEYISSAGLRSVLTMLKLGKESSTTLACCALSSMVEEVFRISGFNSILSIYPTQKDALEALLA